jgi:hypothetical protein
LLAFSEEEFLAALAMASSEAFFNKLLSRNLAHNSCRINKRISPSFWH